MSDIESLEDIPPCPGCGKGWDPGSLQYTATSYKGETWHFECSYEERDDIERVGDHESVFDVLETEEIERLRDEV